MRKLILIGPAINVPVVYGKRPDYDEEVKRLTVQDYMRPNDGSLNDSAEIFLHVHGGLVCHSDSLPPYLFLSIFDEVPISSEPILVTAPSTTSDSDSDLVAPELAHNLISNIIQNTALFSLNIIHIDSCHSGTAHYYLPDVKGSIVLCTYCAPHHESITCGDAVSEFMNSNTDLCLIDRIALNLHLCAACNFSISYKLENEIGNFSINTETSHRENAETLSRFLREKYEELQTFSENLRQSFARHPELKTDHNHSILLADNEPNKQIPPLIVTSEMLGKTFSGILARELCNKECTIDTVRGLLKQEAVSTEDILPHFLNSSQKAATISNIEAFKLLLIHPSTNIDSYIFISIINEDQETLKLLLNYSQTKVTDFVISFTAHPEIIDILSKHNKAIIDDTLIILNAENTDAANINTTNGIDHLIEHSVDYIGNLQE